MPIRPIISASSGRPRSGSISGTPGRIRRLEAKKEVKDVGENSPFALIVPAGVVHAYKNVGDKDGLVFNGANRLYAGWLKQDPVDEIRHEKDPNTPYKLD